MKMRDLPLLAMSLVVSVILIVTSCGEDADGNGQAKPEVPPVRTHGEFPKLPEARMPPTPKIPSATKILADATGHIRSEFDKWLEKPNAYKKRALKECRVFPEGRLYPFAIPALAYSNMALSGEIEKSHAARQMRKLLDTAIPLVGDFVDAPGGDVLRMRSYGKHGTFLSTLNLALANYALASDDGRYKRLHDHVSKLLLRAVRDKNGAPIDSYPTYTWYFDTVMTLTSLTLWDGANGQHQIPPLLNAHLAWRKKHATDPASGLPRAFPSSSSRGCDLSMQVCLLAQLKPALAVELYRDYVKAHWIDHKMAAGFSEWPKGIKAPVGGDIDSGPVIFGIGCTASGVGIGAAKAVGDNVRLERLARQLYVISPLIRTSAATLKDSSALSWFSRGIRVDQEYYTGFLFGDSVLFYALTWTAYPVVENGDNGG